MIMVRCPIDELARQSVVIRPGQPIFVDLCTLARSPTLFGCSTFSPHMSRGVCTLHHLRVQTEDASEVDFGC